MQRNIDIRNGSKKSSRITDYSPGKYCYIWCERFLTFVLFTYVVSLVIEYDPFPSTVRYIALYVVLFSVFLAALSFTWTVGLMPLRVVVMLDSRKGRLLIRRSFVRSTRRDIVDVSSVVSLSYVNCCSVRFGHIYLETGQKRIAVTAFRFSFISRRPMIDALNAIINKAAD